ncbi:FAD-dependent monooxygenase [Pantoea sp.]|uniref:FAD-dependent monooxygenase n=1 Tax=Pantoea sp. TaxID=69393 RepID=UPI0028973BBA|nr:FAD-dependent monooxygenase [Pantoea sp.]
MSDDMVLIAGAGPTGMVLALWLSRLGINVRIIDKLDSHVQQSRAMVVHARTLELYQQCDLAEDLVASGNRNHGINLWADNKLRAHFAFDAISSALTPYPFLLVFPQDHHEALLEKHLNAAGIKIERNSELIDFEDNGNGISATIRRSDNSHEVIATRFLAGCDGVRSRVRERLQIPFKGGTYENTFYVADVEATGSAANGEAWIAFADAEFLVVLPYGRDNRMRLIGTFRQSDGAAPDTLRFEDVSHQAIAQLGLEIAKINWFSTYRVHHRVAETFRRGNAFLLGDAAHVHSPVGGQGMNTGIGDAVNLAWKLAAVLRQQATEKLLGSYEPERQAFAMRLVNTTDKAFSLISAKNSVAGVVRTRLFPVFARTLNHSPKLQQRMFRILSQIRLNYRHSSLCEGKAGEVCGGDRLPWVKTAEEDNYHSLKLMRWQLHLYGEATPALQRWCAEAPLPLSVFSWTTDHHQAGLMENGAYLIRPDGYVALASPHSHEARLDAWFEKNNACVPKSGLKAPQA